MKIVAIIFNLLSGIGIINAFFLIMEGSQPSSGDGCMIHLAFLAGIIVLIPSLIVFFVTFKKAWK